MSKFSSISDITKVDPKDIYCLRKKKTAIISIILLPKPEIEKRDYPVLVVFEDGVTVRCDRQGRRLEDGKAIFRLKPAPMPKMKTLKELLNECDSYEVDICGGHLYISLKYGKETIVLNDYDLTQQAGNYLDDIEWVDSRLITWEGQEP